MNVAVEAAAKAICRYYDAEASWQGYESEAQSALSAALPALTEGLVEVIDAAESSTRTGSKPHRHRVIADAISEELRRRIEI